jgi:hypothetical protein
MSFVEAGNNLSGTLTVTDGSHTAHLTMLGSFTPGQFTSASDGHGGTVVTDPPPPLPKLLWSSTPDAVATSSVVMRGDTGIGPTTRTDGAPMVDILWGGRTAAAISYLAPSGLGGALGTDPALTASTGPPFLRQPQHV